MVARRAHNPKVVGSNPASATSMSVHNGFPLWALFLFSDCFLNLALQILCSLKH